MNMMNALAPTGKGLQLNPQSSQVVQQEQIVPVVGAAVGAQRRTQIVSIRRGLLHLLLEDPHTLLPPLSRDACLTGL